MEKKLKIARFGSIFLLNFAVKEVIDFGLTPIIMVESGFTISLIITNIIYIIIGIVSVLIYDNYGIDVLWLEEWKYSQENKIQTTKSNKLIAFLNKGAQKRNWILCLALTFKNPGLFVIYFRTGSYLYNGFKGKNVKLFFLLNNFIMNMYWNTTVFFGIPILTLLIVLIKESLDYWVYLYQYTLENIYELNNIF